MNGRVSKKLRKKAAEFAKKTSFKISIKKIYKMLKKMAGRGKKCSGNS